MLGVDVGSMILLGAVISIPMLIVAVFYCKWIGKKIYQIPREDGTFDRKKFKEEYIKSMDQLDELIGQKQLPGLWASMAPIVVPLILILANTVLGFVGLSEGPLYQFMELVGSPIVALGSATVAITTAASLSAPIALQLGVSPLLLAQACCVGAISFSYFNDSGFWVWNGMFGVSELKDQVRCKTAVSMIMAGVGIVELLLLSIVM